MGIVFCVCAGEIQAAGAGGADTKMRGKHIFMEFTNGRQRRQVRAAALILGGMLAACGFFSNGSVLCKAKEKETAAAVKQEKDAGTKEEQEVVEFVTSYYEAQSPERIETLADYVDDPQSDDFQRDLLRQQVTFREGGIQGWEILEVIAVPMSDGKHWVVWVSGNLIVEAFDVGVPGAKVELVGRNKEGELKIASYANDPATDSDAFIKEMREISLSDEMIEHNNEVAAAYNDLISERPDIMEWTLKMSEAVDREMQKALTGEALSEKADSEAEESAAKNSSYTVQKGDCLWNIAEQQLGDGMFWSSLYEQNQEVIGEDPDLLYVGITLQLD